MVPLSDKKTKLITFLVSIGLHILVLLIPFSSEKINIQNEPEIYRVPIQLTLTKPKPRPKPKPPAKQNPSQKHVRKKNAKAVAKKPPKPTSLPGDRKTPIVSQKVTPYYPKQALNEGLHGTIIIDAVINYQGKMIRYDMIQSTGHAILDKMFLHTVETKYTFKPKRVMGKNKDGKLRITYTYLP